jgi:hypothetical protein
MFRRIGDRDRISSVGVGTLPQHIFHLTTQSKIRQKARKLPIILMNLFGASLFSCQSTSVDNGFQP